MVLITPVGVGAPFNKVKECVFSLKAGGGFEVCLSPRMLVEFKNQNDTEAGKQGDVCLPPLLCPPSLHSKHG